MPIPPIAIQSHPLWLVRRSIPTPLGPIKRAVLFFGRELTLHGPDAAHVLHSARSLGFHGLLEAVRV